MRAQAMWRPRQDMKRFWTFLAIAVLTLGLALLHPALAQSTGTRIGIPADGTILLPANWQIPQFQPRGAFQIILPAASPATGVHGVEARVLITVEPRKNHADAVRRIASIAAEVGKSPDFISMSGWPALERRYRVTLEHPDKEPPPGGERISDRITLAVAVGNQLIRIEAATAPDADPAVIEQAARILGSAIFRAQGNAETAAQELQLLKSGALSQPRRLTPRTGLLAPSPLRMPGAIPNPASVHELRNQFGELEIAASPDGQNVVIVANNGTAFSNNFGATFSFGVGANAPFGADGDPSVAYAASGTFYFSFIGFPPGNLDGIGVSRSAPPSNGQNWVFAANAFTCPAPNGGGICLDQPHIAADRFNTVQGADQVYVVWRDFQNFGNALIVCSSNSGIRWSAPAIVGQGDFPRISTSADGFAYATFRAGASLMVSKFSSCASGLVLQVGFPQAIDPAASEVMCPLPGLDRCLSGNTMSSHMLAADDGNPSHLYAAYAVNTAPDNDNIAVSDSPDGGNTWRSRQVVNANVAAPRFMPWVCASNGAAYVSWYDRRAATTAANDLTDYYLAGVSIPIDGSAPSLEPEINLSVNPDPQCAGGSAGAQSWPGGTSIQNDSESCSIQPQLAGRCQIPNSNGAGSQQPCDFDEGPPCPNANETCSTGGGVPKYGDYNGNTCAGGSIFTAWASGTAPPNLSKPNGIRIFTSAIALPRLTVRKSVLPSPDGGRFDLQIDNVTQALNVGDQGTTGPQPVNPGPHVAGEALHAGTAPIYVESIGGDCANDGTVRLSYGDNKTCLITNTRMSRDECLANCQMQLEDCISESGRPPSPTPAMCQAAFRKCRASCPAR